MPTFTGTPGADEIIGSEGDDVIDGGNGADRIYARSGNDVIRGFLGALEVYGASGDDTASVISPFNGSFDVRLLDGGEGVDTLDLSGFTQQGTVSGATIGPGSGANAFTAYLASGLSTVTLTRVVDFERIIGANITTRYDLGAVTNITFLQAGSGADDITVGGAPTIRAGAGNDNFRMLASGSQLFGESGNDEFQFSNFGYGAGTVIDGGDGVDTVRLIGQQFGADNTVNFALGDGVFNGVTYRSIESFVAVIRSTAPQPLRFNITGTAASNFVDLTANTGGSYPVTGNVYGEGGDDFINVGVLINAYGGDGSDTISTRGSGSLYGEAGDDFLSGTSSLYGGEGDDSLTATAERTRTPGRFDGGAGRDTLIVNEGLASELITVSLIDGLLTRRGDIDFDAVLSGIEKVVGTSRADTITLANGAEEARGMAGADILRGGAGDDILYGDGLAEASGDGADQLFGDDGDDVMFGGGGADQLSGGAGSDVLVGGTGSNILDGGAGSDVAQFAFARSSATITYSGGDIRVEGLTGAIDTLRGIESLRFSDGVYDVVNGVVAAQARTTAGTTGNDRLTGTAGADMLSGGAGNDILRGGAGSDFIDGGAGVDTARYGGTIRSYSTVSTGLVIGGEEGGIDQLTGIEVLQFLDGRLSFDTTDVSAVVYRLYDAAFDRAPDVFGLADYSRALSEGRATVQTILESFFTSDEFRARYGATTNEQFVREMYRYSLNREGDAAGVAGYVGALIDGSTTRLQLLMIFSESQEHQALTNAVIASRGLFIQDEQTASIARLYDSVFNRLPDLGGLKEYRDALDNGYTLKDVATVLIGSPEFQTRFGTLTNQQFVEQIYRFVLDREGDAAGIQSYVQALSNGYSRTDVVMVLSDSPEHRLSYQATYDSQIRRLGVDGYDPSGSGVGRSVAEDAKHQDAFVLPAEPAFEATHRDDAVAVLETAANDHGLQDTLPVGQWMLLDPVLPDDLTAGHHRSDWM